MEDQEKHVQQSGSAEEKKAIAGAQNAAKNANPTTGPVPAGGVPSAEGAPAEQPEVAVAPPVPVPEPEQKKE